MEALKTQLNVPPQTITPDDVRGLPLHEVTQRYGTFGLQVRLDDTLEHCGLGDNEQVQWAVQFSHMLHADQTRTNGHYTDHVMRVTLRVLEKYGVIDPALTVGTLLHDGVEDHPKDIVLALSGVRIADEQTAREQARHLIALQTSEEAAEIVWDMTTPLTDLEGTAADAFYFDHVKQVVLNQPKPRVGKLSDFIDNGVGNHYTAGPKQERLDRKYLPLWRIHMMGLFASDSLITGEACLEALQQLRRGHARSLARLALAS